MIIQEWGHGLIKSLPSEGYTAGPIEWGLAVVMAVWLTQQIFKMIQNIQERRNGASDLYMDPRTGARMSFPARNLQILHDLVENECEQTQLVKENGEVLERISKTVDERLLSPEEINGRLDMVVRKVIQEELS